MNEQKRQDDPRLTAYALGELDETERAAVGASLDAEGRREVAEIEELAATLSRELTAPLAEGLTAAQRARIEERLGGSAPRRGRLLSFRAAAWAGGIAASLAVAMGTVIWFQSQEGAVGMTPETAIARLDQQYAGTGAERASNARARRRSTGPAAPGAPAGRSELDALDELGYLGEPMEEPMLRELRALGYSQDAGEADRKQVARVEADRGAVLADAEEPQFPSDSPYEDEQRFDTEAYDHVRDNPFVAVATDPRSTFSVDVDTASYANVRRFLRSGQLPPPGAVRIEEMVNYFDYAYPEPAGPVPFSVTAEVADCPWRPEHRLVKIGLKGREASFEDRPRNLVFLLDVSGSMDEPDKLPLLVRGMTMLVEGLGERDQVAIVVYAGASGLVLPPTPGSQKGTILDALNRLDAGGSTNGGAGIELAYATAERNFVTGGINRVILASDGDFNVGTTSRSELIRLIEEKRASGVFLSVLGFGTGNLKDATMEQLADHGNGSYHYIDGLNEARKVLVRDVNATLETIAKDVKIQVEFNPAEATAFRLVGYENRVLAHQDFRDDRVDAGDIGAGHTVTALYEVVPAGVPFEGPGVDPLRYQPESVGRAAGISNGELLNVALRWKEPDGAASSQVDVPVPAARRSLAEASDDFRFAAGVALFGMVLRGSPHAGDATAATALELARSGAGPDRWGYRAEFLELVQRAADLGR